MSHHEAGRRWANALLNDKQQGDAEFEVMLATGTQLDSGSGGVLVAEGDSWFDYHPFNNKDILKWLRKRHGYDVREAGPKFGDTLQEMADDPGQLMRVVSCLEKIAEEGGVPRAILLSGGGNDIATKESLSALLNHKLSGLPPLKEEEVQHFIFKRMKGHLLQWIGAVDAACESYFDTTFPIFVHGYAKPVPDGDAFGWDWAGVFPGPWLKPAFVRKGYWGTEDNRVPTDVALAETTPLVGRLIDLFNTMLEETTAEVAHLHHIDLRHVLSNSLPDGYKADWANELHPKKSGFKALAQAVADRIEEVL